MRYKPEVRMTTPHDLDRLQRIREVTSDYGGYQGLYTSLLGVFAICVGLAPLTGEGPLTDLFPVGMLLIAALFIAVQQYYRRRCGRGGPRDGCCGWCCCRSRWSSPIWR
ncbi:hypothetical protein GCM10009642_23260 [Nocardiopsis metallicus]